MFKVHLINLFHIELDMKLIIFTHRGSTYNFIITEYIKGLEAAESLIRLREGPRIKPNVFTKLWEGDIRIAYFPALIALVNKAKKPETHYSSNHILSGQYDTYASLQWMFPYYFRLSFWRRGGGGGGGTRRRRRRRTRRRTRLWTAVCLCPRAWNCAEFIECIRRWAPSE